MGIMDRVPVSFFTWSFFLIIQEIKSYVRGAPKRRPLNRNKQPEIRCEKIEKNNRDGRKMKGKRVITGILLVGILAVTLAGCKNTDENKKETGKPRFP